MNWGFLTTQVKCNCWDGLNIDILEPVIYQAKDGTVYRMPTTATSDGASTPRLIYSLGFTPFGSYWPAALMHDSAYRNTLQKLTGGSWTGDQWAQAALTKPECDSLLQEAMEWLEVPETKALAIYLAVRDFGNSSFNNDRGL